MGCRLPSLSHHSANTYNSRGQTIPYESGKGLTSREGKCCHEYCMSVFWGWRLPWRQVVGDGGSLSFPASPACLMEPSNCLAGKGWAVAVVMEDINISCNAPNEGGGSGLEWREVWRHPQLSAYIWSRVHVLYSEHANYHPKRTPLSHHLRNSILNDQSLLRSDCSQHYN